MRFSLETTYHEVPGYRDSLRRRVRSLLAFLRSQSRDDDVAAVKHEFLRRLEPRTASEYLLHADFHRDLKEWRQANADYDTAVGMKPSAEAYFTRGEFYLNSLKNYAKAVRDFDKSLQIDPKPGHRYKRRALAHFCLRHYDKALADISRAIELKPGDGSNLYWIPPELVAKCPEKDFRDGMLKLADEAIKKKDSAYVRYGRARLLSALGQHRLALADYTKAIELEPKKDVHWRHRAEYFINLGRWPEALDDFVKADELEPKYYTRYQHALTALGASNRSAYLSDCRQMLNRFAKSNEANVGHFTVWTCALSAGALDDYSTPIRIAERLVKPDSANAFHRQGLGAILFRAGRFEEARKHLEAATAEEEPARTSAAYAWYFLAMTHHRLGDISQAARALATANRLANKELKDPTKPPAWNRRLTLELLRKEATALIGSARSRVPVVAPRPTAPP